MLSRAPASLRLKRKSLSAVCRLESYGPNLMEGVLPTSARRDRRSLKSFAALHSSL